LPSVPADEYYGDQGDQGLWHGSTDCGQDASDRPFGQSEALPYPFNAVSEELASDQDDDEAEQEDDQVHLNEVNAGYYKKASPESSLTATNNLVYILITDNRFGDLLSTRGMRAWD
jgi:hypothetical protein